MRQQPENPEKYRAMRAGLSESESHEELKRMAVMLYVTDLSYPRADICLVLKDIETEKGWR